MTDKSLPRISVRVDRIAYDRLRLLAGVTGRSLSELAGRYVEDGVKAVDLDALLEERANQLEMSVDEFRARIWNPSVHPDRAD